MKFNFSKVKRLLRRGEFLQLYQKGQKHVGKKLVIFYILKSSPSVRLGVTITKKWGKAHDRNRFKRIIREGFRNHYPRLREGLVLNVQPRAGYQELTVCDVIQEFRQINDFNDPTQSKSEKSDYHY